MTRILIAGGSGLIGKALTKALLEKGYEVIVLTRDVKKLKGKNAKLKIDFAEWNVEKKVMDEKAISTADYIIHLAGASIAEKRWTKRRKQEIVSSRVESGKLIVECLKRIPNKVKAVICSSAIGWYGPDLTPGPSPGGEGSNRFNETDFPANDFLGKTCQQWEAAIEPAKEIGKRLVKFRTGIVLSNDGGALKEFKKPLRFGVATILGSGKQIISWIHIDDLVRMYIMAIENENLSGVYNAVSPYPVSNKELIIELAKQSRGKFFIPIHVPSFVLKMVLGEMSIEVLKSATISSKKIEQSGFTFLYPLLTDALQQLIKK